MTIEFQTDYGKVREKRVSDIRNEILKLSHINKDISRAEVILKKDELVKQQVMKQQEPPDEMTSMVNV